MTHNDCSDCLNREYCEHTSMDFCMVNTTPAWMSRIDFYDPEIDECKHLRLSASLPNTNQKETP